MHRDRDFDVQQAVPWNERALTQDLELDQLLRAMAGPDEFLFEVARQALLSGMHNDVPTVRYRQETLKDCLRNPIVVRELYDLIVATLERSRKEWWGISGHYASSMLYSAVDLLGNVIGDAKETESHRGRSGRALRFRGLYRAVRDAAKGTGR